MITTISIIIGVTLSIIGLFSSPFIHPKMDVTTPLRRFFDENYTNRQFSKDIILLWVIPICVGCLSFIFLYESNNRNVNYLSQYKSNAIEMKDSTDHFDEFRYEFITYDRADKQGEKYLGVLYVDNGEDFKRHSSFTFYLRDINGDLVYYVSSEDRKLLEKIKKTFNLEV